MKHSATGTVKFDKEALKKALADAGMTAPELSYEIGRSQGYVSNLIKAYSDNNVPTNTAFLMARILNVPLKQIVQSIPKEPANMALLQKDEEVSDHTDDQPTYLRSDDATLRQLVDQLYAMNAKLNVLYKMVAHLEEAFK